MLESLINFLKAELKVPAEAISIGLKGDNPQPHTLPIVLLQYGLIDLTQLDRIYDWLEA